MPAKVEFVSKDLDFITKELLGIGYRKITPVEKAKIFKRLGLIPPKSGSFTSEATEGFIFTSAHGLSSYAWTSFSKELQVTIDQRMAWSLIADGDDAVYFSKPVHRTKGFLLQILRKAWVAKWRVENRPLCCKCQAFMEIRERYKDGKPTGQYYWGCFHSEKHDSGKPEFLGWDKIGPKGDLPEKAKAYVEMMRGRVAAYNKRNKKLGIVRKKARFIRKGWDMSKPENKIKITP